MTSIDDESYDIFISYAEPDNRLPAPLNDWVRHLYDSLPGLIQFHLKRLPRVYFAGVTADPSCDLEHIKQCCRRARVFLAIASPNYLARGWPQEELNAFVSTHENLDGLFVVHLTHLKPTAHPILGRKTHKAFYEEHPYRADDVGDAFPVEPGSDAFSKAIRHLATSIARYLKDASDDQDAPASPHAHEASHVLPANPVARVLLAQPSGDLEEVCEAVPAYFQQFGIEVIPASDFPQGGDAFRAAFEDALGRATHFVQLLGPRRGRHPPDLPEGYVVFQAEAARKAGLPAMQWRSLEWEIADDTDPDYGQLLRRETVVASTLEEFKREACRAIASPPKPAGVSGASRKNFKVFVNAELADRNVAERLRAELRDYPVFHPDYDVDGSNQEITLQHLRDCHALILLYGRAGLNWVNAQMGEVFKHRGAELPGGAVCVGPPSEKRPLNFSVPGIVELDCCDGDNWSVEPIRRRLAELSQ